MQPTLITAAVVTMVPKEAVDAVWLAVEQILRPAVELARGELYMYDVRMRCLLGTMQLWVIAEAAVLRAVAVTEVIDYPQTTAVRITLLAGEGMPEWQEQLLQKIERFGRTVGASRVEAYGRKGFVRALAPLGFELAYYAIMKEIKR